ncbi:hypothetical protein IWQ61_010176 [Dispira simplex]|nr:hypothetical protein IWQ61_010176 [Dispira simplex]
MASTPGGMGPGLVVSAHELFGPGPGPAKRKKGTDRDETKSLAATSLCTDHTAYTESQSPADTRGSRKHGLGDRDDDSLIPPSAADYPSGSQWRTTKRLRMAGHSDSPDVSNRPRSSEDRLSYISGLKSLPSTDAALSPSWHPSHVRLHPDLRFSPPKRTADLVTSVSDLEHGRLIDVDTGEVLEAFQSRPSVSISHTADPVAHPLIPTQEVDAPTGNRISTDGLNINSWPTCKITTQPHGWTPPTDGRFEVLVDFPQNTSSSLPHPIHAHRESHPIPLYRPVPGNHGDIALVPEQPHALVLYRAKPEFFQPGIADPGSTTLDVPGTDSSVPGKNHHTPSIIVSQDAMDLD